MKEKSTTVTSTTEGLRKLIREVRTLQKEVAALHDSLRGFTRDRNIHRGFPRILPPEAGGNSYESKSETDEPRSDIVRVRNELIDKPDLEIPTKIILAIAKQLDGALRDIRSARMDIKAIADDPDLRDEFAEWQKNQS